MNRDRRYFLGTAATAIAATQFDRFGYAKALVHRLTPAAFHSPSEGELDSLSNATTWLNSAPLTAAGLRGKVVLIDFCTYTCINWLRTLPYIRAWGEQYKDQGLVVIGVHTPEFPFEKDIDFGCSAIVDFLQ